MVMETDDLEIPGKLSPETFWYDLIWWSMHGFVVDPLLETDRTTCKPRGPFAHQR